MKNTSFISFGTGTRFKNTTQAAGTTITLGRDLYAALAMRFVVVDVYKRQLQLGVL